MVLWYNLTMSRLPIVALIGQTNAGKSSLLNRMARKNIAIVAREEGTTRDNVMATIDERFVLIDTAGLKDPSDDFEASIQDQIADAIETADIILVTLDSSKYFDHKDAKIAKNALKSKKPVFLVLNKSDLKESLPITEFRALGIAPEKTFYVSATTGQGVETLKNALLKTQKSDFSTVTPKPFSKKPVSASLKLALIGRPNVGKSSLFNSLSKKQQAIVSSRQGTTRDVNRVNVKFKGRDIEILDTAGLRRPGKREVGIEKFSTIRTLAAIEEADICALLVDATEPRAKLDQALAGQIIKAGKGIIVVITKTDLVKEKQLEDDSVQEISEKMNGLKESVGETDESNKLEKPVNIMDKLLDNLEIDFNFIPYAPALLTSAETGKNVTQLFELALEVDKYRHQEVKTSELNKILNDAIVSHPPAGLKNTRPKPKYIVQTDVAPPWFVVHGHDLGLLHWSWKRFLERKIREKCPFVGTPIVFSFRNDKKS